LTLIDCSSVESKLDTLPFFDSQLPNTAICSILIITQSEKDELLPWIIR
jgi:hypothetical protein